MPSGKAYTRLTIDTYEAWPLDIRLLELLPDEGLIGGVHHAGRKSVALVDDINREAGEVVVKSSTVSARLRTMGQLGLVKHFPATGGMVWARTVMGKRFLVKYQLASQPQDQEKEVGPEADSKSEPRGVTALDNRRVMSG